MKKLLYPLIALLSFQLSFAQGTEVKIDMIDANWDLPDDAAFESFDNRRTLILNNGRATVKTQDFKNGAIEVDIFANSGRSFAGITFRKQDGTMEEVYLRMHKSGQVDAVQYTPIFNEESNWQLFSEYQARVAFKDTGWNTLRVEINGNSAEVFVNDASVMSVDHLRTGHEMGQIGLFALFTNRFSNFRLTPGTAVVRPEKAASPPADSNTITEWAIAPASPYREGELHFEDFAEATYRTVKAEASGLLPFSKYLKKSSAGRFEQNAEDYTVASTTVYASKSETRLFSFDYSDKIIVYLNGTIVFRGNNAFRAKGVQYMGHLDIDTNTLYLPLEKGVNTIHCVVIDKANGWGIMGKLDP